ncbi:hypothetical protein HID58_007928, partial [Brassica napus]
MSSNQIYKKNYELMSKEMAKINRDVLMLREDQAPKVGASLSQSEPRKISMVGIKPHIPDLNVQPISDSTRKKEKERNCKRISESCSDKETVSVGTQLIVIGREIDGIVVFRYELENHKWFKVPSMITPRPCTVLQAM